jgi:hypothetical protein
MPSLGEMGGGMPSLGTGASGFGQQLADLIGGLVGSGDGALPDPPDLEPEDDVDEPEKRDEPDEDAETEPADAADESAPEGGPETPDEELVPPEPAATPVPLPPEPPIPPAVPEALPVEPTPCEIAADELPQVGE